VIARSRVAFATGVAGLAGATLLLTGRFDGSVVVALLFVGAARAAAPACLVHAAPVVSAAATRALAQQISFAPAWGLIVAAGAVRAGSSALTDARGANAVAGLAVTHGDVVAVVGAWFAIAAGMVAIASRSPLEGETAFGVVPPTLQRLEIGAVVGQAALLVTLFAGPQVSAGLDAVPWVVGIAAAASVAWAARRTRIPNAALAAFALAAIGLGATIAGGAP
jgi:hypothetical protein